MGKLSPQNAVARTSMAIARERLVVRRAAETGIVGPRCRRFIPRSSAISRVIVGALPLVTPWREPSSTVTQPQALNKT